MRMRRILCALPLVWLAMSLTALAQSPTKEERKHNPALICPICRRVNGDVTTPYGQKAGLTLTRGLLNTTFGWTEMLLQPTAEAENGGNPIVGFGHGVGSAIKRTGEGVGEIFTFWVPRKKHDPASLVQDCPICMEKRRKKEAEAAARLQQQQQQQQQQPESH